MAEVLSSSQLIETLEDVIWKQPERIATLWTWGYALDQIEMHRWHAGRLFGYSLASPEEFPHVRAGFLDLRNAIAALEQVQRVDSSAYVLNEDAGWGSELRGEKWCIIFARGVVYDHWQVAA